MAEAEEELLEERLTQQKQRLEQRETKLEEYDQLRQRIEYEKATLRSEAREHRRQEEMELQVLLIEEAEEKRRQDDMARETHDAQQRLTERMSGMTAAEKAAFLEDLAELEMLEEKLANTTESLEQRQDSMKRIIAEQEAARQNEENVHQTFFAMCRKAGEELEEEEVSAAALLEKHFERLQTEHEAERVLAGKEISRRKLEARRHSVESTLSAADRNHIAALSAEERGHLLDEVHELKQLKERLKKHTHS